MAAVVPIDAPMLSWLRMRLLEDAETGMALATVRAALLLYGVRGVEGRQRLSKELASPELSRLLPSSDPEATKKMLNVIVQRHEQEVARREEAGPPLLRGAEVLTAPPRPARGTKRQVVAGRGCH